MHDEGTRVLPARTVASTRALMQKYGVGFNTVQRALTSALPEPRKKMKPRTTRLHPYKPVIDATLKADLTAPRKQHHTVKRIYDRLLDEHEAVDVSTRWSAPTWPPAVRRSVSRPARGWWRRSSRGPTGPGRRPRSTSATSR